jgi:hypothetical protein
MIVCEKPESSTAKDLPATAETTPKGFRVVTWRGMRTTKAKGYISKIEFKFERVEVGVFISEQIQK